MPWYKCEYHFGPGHQSTWEKYVWRDEGAYNDDLCEDVWESGPYTHSSQVSGECKVVESLPDEVRGAMIKTEYRKIEAAQEMLKRLGAEASQSEGPP